MLTQPKFRTVTMSYRQTLDLLVFKNSLYSHHVSLIQLYGQESRPFYDAFMRGAAMEGSVPHFEIEIF